MSPPSTLRAQRRIRFSADAVRGIQPAEGGVALAVEHCYGCGVCIGSCRAGALSLRRREPALPGVSLGEWR
ncbi:MAG: hypothetical protein ACYC5O_15780 [Anaerolineae bacterium]